MTHLPNQYPRRRFKASSLAFAFWVFHLSLCLPAALLGQARIREPEPGNEFGSMIMSIVDEPKDRTSQQRVSFENAFQQVDTVPALQPEPGNSTPNPPISKIPMDQLFRVESERQLKERMLKEYMAQGQTKVAFPPEATVRFLKRPQLFPRATAFLENANLCSYPLYFEDARTERHGLYCPLVQPLVSTSLFYFDTLVLPFKMIVAPPWSLRSLDAAP